jgi:hypothetical protein
MKLSKETISFVTPTSVDIPGALNSGTVSAVVRDQLRDDLVAPVCTEMSQKTASLAKLRCGVDETCDTLDELDGILLDDDDADLSDLYVSVQGGPAVDLSVLEKRKTAKDFLPGIPNMLWCGLNSPEAQTASNFLWELLCIHDSVPPSTMIQKLMDLMKYGPKAEGSSLYFKDPHRTELAAQYVYGLLSASKRLVRIDSGALFGPSSWDDIEVLMAQSVAETENMISGRRLAQGLQLAAR